MYCLLVHVHKAKKSPDYRWVSKLHIHTFLSVSSHHLHSLKEEGKKLAQFKARGESSWIAEYFIYWIFLGRGFIITKALKSQIPSFGIPIVAQWVKNPDLVSMRIRLRTLASLGVALKLPRCGSGLGWPWLWQRPHPRHIEIPRPGIKSKPQLCQCQILNPLRHSGKSQIPPLMRNCMMWDPSGLSWNRISGL